MAGVVESRFARWRDGQRRQLLDEWRTDRARSWTARQQRATACRHRTREAEQAERRAQTVARVLELVSEGELSRAMRLLHSLGCSDITEGVLAQLRAKHPLRRRLVPRDLQTQVPHVSVSLTEDFRSLRRRSGTGPSGCRNEYLRALVGHFDDARADGVMELYDDFGSALASGELPMWY